VQTAQLVKQQWQAIGVETEIASFGAGTIQQSVIRPRDYEILLFGEILPAEPDPYPFWHSTQTRSPGLNFALFQDKEVDKLLEKARKTANPDDRRALYQQFQERILELKPAIILYRPYYLFAQKSRVRGVDIKYGDLPASRFNNVEAWHVRVKRVWN
jgi:peptide/nickel transport system substrate-binding protein